MGRCPFCNRRTLIGCARANGYCLIWPEAWGLDYLPAVDAERARIEARTAAAAERARIEAPARALLARLGLV